MKYIAQPISKYAIHARQLSNTPRAFHEHIRGRLAVIEHLFSENGFFETDEIKKLECVIGQLRQFLNHVQAYQMKDEELALEQRIKQLSARLKTLGTHTSLAPRTYVLLGGIWGSISRRVPASIRRRLPSQFKSRVRALYSIIGERILATTPSPADMRRSKNLVGKLWLHTASATPSGVRKLIPLRLRRAGERCFSNGFTFAFYWSAFLYRLVCSVSDPSSYNSSVSVGSVMLPQWIGYYPDAAARYQARGQTPQALDMWKRAEPLNDPQVDGLACQAILKLTTATYDDLARFQRRWSERYAKPIRNADKHHFPVFDHTRKIKVGYHCSFMNSDTIRFIMRNVVAAHDRSKFEIFAYSPTPMSPDIKTAFDVARSTASMGDMAFLNLVRRDKIDVFVELSGFSPGHRYVAMASRCAPVQISYLNHHGTSCIDAVDYFLSDEISTPSNSDADRTFTETIYRLPDCLLCYDYRCDPHPPVTEPPSIKRGFVTFGCFGHGGKINIDLIEMWAELLLRVPRSMFYIRNGQLTPADNRRYLADRFLRYGISGERLRIEGGTERMSLLSSYADVDITMDTWPYCGGNTVAESLWQGVPVITYMGSRMSSRYGASLLTAAGCADLIGHSVDEYIDIAAELARQPQRLATFRKNLRRMCEEHGLADLVGFARKLEQAYDHMLRERSTLPAQNLHTIAA